MALVEVIWVSVMDVKVGVEGWIEERGVMLEWLDSLIKFGDGYSLHGRLSLYLTSIFSPAYFTGCAVVSSEKASTAHYVSSAYTPGPWPPTNTYSDIGGRANGAVGTALWSSDLAIVTVIEPLIKTTVNNDCTFGLASCCDGFSLM